MRSLGPLILTLALVSGCLAQGYLGGAAGYGVAKGLTVNNAAGSASTGFKSGAVLGAFAGHDLYDYLGGELRYLYRFSDMKLSSGGTDYSFSAYSHAVHYDLLIFARPRQERVRPFAAVGGGIRYFRGTGKEHAVHPLSTFAILTHTSQLKGLATFGGGVQVKLAPHAFLRVEFRDYFSPVPKLLITPVPGAKLSSCWMHDFTPLASIGFRF
jgi:hypothetical protein